MQFEMFKNRHSVLSITLLVLGGHEFMKNYQVVLKVKLKKIQTL